jgi:hypothetical protein
MALDWTHLVAGGAGAVGAILAALPSLIKKGGKVLDAVRAAQDSEIVRTLKMLKDSMSSMEQGNAARVGGLGIITAQLTKTTEMQVELAAKLGAVEEANRKILENINGWGRKLEAVKQDVEHLRASVSKER